MKILLLALTIVLSAMIGTMADPSRSRTDRFTSTHPDINKNIPIWTMITVSNKDFAIIRRLMGGPLISRNPIIRLWSNLTPDDKLKCPVMVRLIQ